MAFKTHCVFIIGIFAAAELRRKEISSQARFTQSVLHDTPFQSHIEFVGVSPFHLETLKDDAPLLLKMAGIDDRVTFPRIHKSTGSDEVLAFYSQVPPEYITRLRELYRSDFEMFGYDYLGHGQPPLNNSQQTINFKS